MGTPIGMERIERLRGVLRGDMAQIPDDVTDVERWIRQETLWVCQYAEEIEEDQERDYGVLKRILRGAPKRRIKALRDFAEVWRMCIGTSPSIPEWIVEHTEREMASAE